MIRNVLIRPLRIIGAVGLLLWSARQAGRNEVSVEEEQLFRAFNDGDSARMGFGVWMVMQAGSCAAVPVVSLLVSARRGRPDGFVVAVAGATAWLAGKGLKAFVGRGRPGDLLPDVVIRGEPQTGLGYPSGHAAVALTLALTSARRPTPRMLAIATAGVVSGARIRAGAHLPWDVGGGLAVGALIGSSAAGLGRRASGRARPGRR